MFGEMVEFILKWRERHGISDGQDLTTRQVFRLEKDIRKYIVKLYKEDVLLNDKTKSAALVYIEDRMREGGTAWAIARKKEEASGGKQYSLYHTDPYAFKNDQNIIEAVRIAVNNNPIDFQRVVDRWEMPKTLSGTTIWWHLYNLW